MSQPIKPNKESTGFFEVIAKGLHKAYTPCQEYCMEKCQRAWDKGKKTLPCSPDSPSSQRCIKSCKDFQYRSPLYTS